MSALSTPMPASAESTCSTVCTLTLPSAIVVERSTVFTFSIFASMIGSSARSLRLNLRPCPGGAGCTVRVTFSPVCSEEPLMLALLARVDWKELMRSEKRRASYMDDKTPADKPLVPAGSILAFDREEQRIHVPLVAGPQPAH